MNTRMRRIRNNPHLRPLVRESGLNLSDFIYPLFVVEGENIRREISSLPGNYHLSIDQLEKEVLELEDLGIPGVLLFGIPDHKDATGSSAYAKEGIVQRAIKEIKRVSKKLLVITDVCLCEYTDHGHCGLLNDQGGVENDLTLDYLAKTALSHAQAGADVVAPSDMMDFRVAAIRKALDEHGYKDIPIMAYSAKYASSYYGPFREAADSTPAFGDRKSYQMDYHNSDEAMKEIALDLEEGADMIIIKPALAYLDILQRAKDKFNVPLVAYQVSGEYAMLYQAVKAGLLGQEVIYESLIALKRAGAGLIISYFAKDMAKVLKEDKIELI
ncbi:MAG: porphobilinogen synthase [Tissierellia bacterium]|nr:porphobilinogen synthase [Tissierellia bacterium]